MVNKPIIVLFGPTASGKSALALSIAQKIGAVIINCDSKQLYKEIPIITAQPSEEEKQVVPHEMYGVISVAEHCSVGRWIEMVRPVIEKVWAEGKVPMLVGGTGMYIKYLTEGIPQIPDISDDIRRKVRAEVESEGSAAVHAKLDDVMRERLNAGDTQRVARAYEVLLQTGKSLADWQEQPAVPVFKNVQFINFFLSPDREKVYHNCNIRFEKMMDADVMEEIKRLDTLGLSDELPSMRSHGVPELLAYMHGTMSREDAVDQAQKNTRHYIKRQFTWFRGQMSHAHVLDSEGAERKMMEILSVELGS